MLLILFSRFCASACECIRAWQHHALPCHNSDHGVLLPLALLLQIFRFYYRCKNCAAEFTMKTDPKTSDYVLEEGASRNYEHWREEEQVNSTDTGHTIHFKRTSSDSVSPHSAAGASTHQHDPLPASSALSCQSEVNASNSVSFWRPSWTR